jgi:hypothetical protein
MLLVPGCAPPAHACDPGGAHRAARPSLPALAGDARRHLVEILLQVLYLRPPVLDGDPHEIADRQHGQEAVAAAGGCAPGSTLGPVSDA